MAARRNAGDVGSYCKLSRFYDIPYPNIIAAVTNHVYGGT